MFNVKTNCAIIIIIIDAIAAYFRKIPYFAKKIAIFVCGVFDNFVMKALG